MLIPSIDLMGGRIVQLVQGEHLKLAFDDFEYWIQRFAKYPMVQLIDLDAAMRQGENRVLIQKLAKRLPCQVGGGIHSVAAAKEMLEAGAQRVILGSALFGAGDTEDANGAPVEAQLVRTAFARELAETLGEDRLVFSVDTKNGKVAVKGWKGQADLTPETAIRPRSRALLCCASSLHARR